MTTEGLDPLSRLAVRAGTDKFGAHLYTPNYDKILGHLRDRPLRILEIGTGGYDLPQAGGSSLRMWCDYFPFAKIVGLDIAPHRLRLSPRVTLVQGSQDDLALLQRITDAHGPFDVIIDDGSHVVSHVLTTFRFMYPRLPPAGMYVVEDTQTSFFPPTGGNPAGAGTIFSLAHSLSLAMHHREGWKPNTPQESELVDIGRMTESISFHRNIIVFQRGANAYPSNFQFDLGDPKVVEVFRAIEAEAAVHPTSRSYLSRIDMLIWGRNGGAAAELAVKAANEYPNDEELLAELIRLMDWAGAHEVAATMRRRFEALSSRGAG